jgi:hypothetical protein
MHRFCTVNIMAVGWLIGLTACAAELETENHGHELVTSSLISPNRIMPNRLMPNRIGANRIGANRIGANRIGANRLAVNTIASDDLLSTPDGRELFTYIASCAMAAPDVLEATVDGQTYEFPGSIGLAPEWEDRALSLREQRWVSACLIARVNAHDVSVLISMRGDHEALSVSQEEEQAYDLEEGAFYGNVFVPESEPIEWFACRGTAQRAGEIGDLVDRDCTEPKADGKTACGFTFTGECSHPSTCLRDAVGDYAWCRTDATPRHWRQREVITVFVRH